MLAILLLLAAAASNTDFPSCNATITNDLLTRCALSERLTLSGTSGATTIYLHNGQSRSANVTLPDDSSYPLPPGKGLQVLLSPAHSQVAVHCADCLLTVWHTPSLSHVNASFVSDAAGAVFNATSVTLATDYIVYFDFGDTVRFRVYSLVHRREKPLVVFQQRNGTIATTDDLDPRSKRDIDVTGPGFFKLAFSPFLVTTFMFIVGSTVKIPSQFSNKPATGNFALWHDGVVTSRGRAADTFIHPAAEHQAWAVLAWVMVGLAVLIFVASLIAILRLGFAQCREWCKKEDALAKEEAGLN
jgi:hypothetical protein